MTRVKRGMDSLGGHFEREKLAGRFERRWRIRCSVGIIREKKSAFCENKFHFQQVMDPCRKHCARAVPFSVYLLSLFCRIMRLQNPLAS